MAEIHTEYIKLDQFLKLTGVIKTGGEAKLFIASNDVQVNGVHEDRRGRKLYPGDIVTVNGRKFSVG